jgi:hypothetical protein
MSHTGGHTGGLSPDAVQTEIDAIIFETEAERSNQPSYVGAPSGTFFKQGSTDLRKFIWDEDAGVPNVDEVAEQEQVPQVSTFIGNTKEVSLTKNTNDLPISWEAFKVGGIGAEKRSKLGKQIADAVVRTRDEKAMVRTYGDAFNGTFYTTPDGDALASNSHTTLRGDNVDNLEAGALSPDTLWAGFVSLQTQLGQHGSVNGYLPSGVLTCSTQYKKLKEIMNSEAIADSAENNLNIFETDYGRVSIGQSPFLNSAADAGTYKATAVHLVSDQHSIMRKVFSGLETYMIDPQYTTTHSYVMRYLFDEVSFPGTWAGYVGLQGA